MGMDAYSNILLNSANFSDIVIALLKSIVLGFFIILIPIRFGLQASHELTTIPIVVSHGMVNVFTAILTIEVLSLIIKLHYRPVNNRTNSFCCKDVLRPLNFVKFD
jgi:phospholipid/cholesterol/gamma-HCH transport system permease protein